MAPETRMLWTSAFGFIGTSIREVVAPAQVVVVRCRLALGINGVTYTDNRAYAAGAKARPHYGVDTSQK